MYDLYCPRHNKADKNMKLNMNYTYAHKIKSIVRIEEPETGVLGTGIHWGNNDRRRHILRDTSHCILSNKRRNLRSIFLYAASKLDRWRVKKTHRKATWECHPKQKM